jgi:uncharacterized protein (TIGR02271 family)
VDRTNQSTVVGVFDNRDQADRAVEELRRMGFRDDQIGYAMRGGDNTVAESTGNAAGEGLATGAVIGGLVGAAAALLIPGIGPVVAGGVLASVLGGAAVGAAAGGILGALVGMGIPEDEATYYEGEFQAGRILVTVKADTRAAEAREVLRRFGAYDVENRGGGGTDRMTATPTGTGTHGHEHTHSGETHAHEHQHTGEHAHRHGAGARGEASVQLREEQLTANKQTVQAGEVEIGKRVVSEQRTMEVPVTREEVTIERTPVNRPANTPVGADTQTVRVPVHEERVEFEKRPVVTEEVSVNKRPVQDVERHTTTVNREEAVINRNWNSWDEARPHFQSRWQERFGARGGRWDEYEPHYRYGWEMSRRPEYQGKQWGDFESQWQKDWEMNHQGHPWEKAKEGVRDAWEWATGTQVRR